MIRRWHVFDESGSKKMAVITLDSGHLSVEYFDDAARREIAPLLKEPIEHEVGESVMKNGVMIGVATGWGISDPGTDGHFLALKRLLILRGYWPGLDEGTEEQAATA